MSRFFKALEQAEHDRAVRQQNGQTRAAAAPAAPTIEAPPAVDAPRAVPTAPLAPAIEPTVVAPAPAVAARAAGSRIDERLVSVLAPGSFEAEQYRSLRHLVEQFRRTADLSVVAVSSPVAGDGKTMTAVNLAGALAQAPEARILIIDADLRRPSVGRYLGLSTTARPGLVDAILDPSITLAAVTTRRPPFNLSVITAGRMPAVPYEVLRSARFGELLEQARREYDVVIVDTPPLVSVPNSRVIERLVDGFIVVVAAHKTPRRMLQEALALTDPTKVVGIVFNGDDQPLPAYYATYPDAELAEDPRGRSGGVFLRVRRACASVGRRVRSAGSKLRRRRGRPSPWESTT